MDSAVGADSDGDERMTRSWIKLQRSLKVGALSLGLMSVGTLNACFANFADYQALATGFGKATIQTVSDTVFGNIGTDFDTIVRTPTTTFAQTLWANFVDSQVPDDIPNTPIVKR